MAKFQNPKYHEDTTPKRPLSADDIEFLKNLQKELNTQDSMGNADPRFWVVKQPETYPTSEDYADDTVIVDDNDGESWDTLDEFMTQFQDCESDIAASCDKNSGKWKITVDDETEYVSDMHEAVQFLQENGIEQYSIRYIRQDETVISDSLFLTHKDCEDYLRLYGYNHHPDAHAYAMTAIRSPRYERLLNILRTTDFELLAEELKER